MSSFEPHVLDFVANSPHDVPPHDPNFPQVLDAALDELKAYPSFMYVQMRRDYPEAQEDGSHYAEFQQALFWNASGWLNFALYSTVYKTIVLLEDVASGLNQRRTFGAMFAARGVLEYAATFRDFRRQVARDVEAMEAAHRAIQESDRDSAEFWEAVQVYDRTVLSIVDTGQAFGQATRFNWQAFFQADPAIFNSAWNDLSENISQKNVMTLLEKYPEQKTPKVENTLLRYYALLCDYTHPNLGSHHLVTERVTDIDGNNFMYAFQPVPASDIPMIHAIRGMSIPLSLVLPELMKDFTYIRSLQQMFLSMSTQLLNESTTDGG